MNGDSLCKDHIFFENPTTTNDESLLKSKA
jgi:hypothetical protein